MEKRILAQLRNRNPIAQGSSGAVCVSGGGDSVALLRILSALKNRLGLKLEVLHFDHRLRPESAAEAEWVARLAQELELPCRVRSTDRLKRLNSGVQAAASAWRRAESLDALQRHGLDWAATAHHRDDHLETLIMALLRGGHIAHFRGIAAAAPPYVRPLLAVSHEELLAYLRDIGQPWLEDPSNRSPKYLRNRVRHELMPLLLDLTGGGLDRRLMALARQSAEVNELLGSYAHVAQSDPAAPRHWIDADELARLPGIVATEALSQFVQERMPGTLRHDQLESAVRLLAGGGTEWRLHLSHHRGLQRLGSRIILASTAEEGQPPVTVTVDGFRVTVPPDTRLSGGAAGSDEASGEDSLSLYNLAPGAVLNLRRPRQGDRFHPPGRSNSIPLNEYLRARGIPLYERRRLPVAAIADCSGAEQVIGIYPGIAAQHFAIPRDASVRGLCIRIEYWPQ